MDLLLLGALNPNLARGKLAPLLTCRWVDRIDFVARTPGPPLDRVSYLIAPDSPTLLRRTSALLRRLAEGLRRSPALVLAYNVTPFGLVSACLARLRGIPYAIAVIGGPLEIAGGGTAMENRLLARLPGLAPVNERLAMAVLRGALFVTTTGQATRLYLIGRGLPADRIYAMPSAIDPKQFRPGDVCLDIDVLCVSSLIARKRVERVLALAAQLRRHRPGLRVTIVGEGPLRSSLEVEATRLGLAGNVSFVGWQADVRPYLWRTRSFVLTSATEGLPLAMIEAMACGVPPVVAAVGDVADLVEDGVTGRLLATDDVDEMADAVAGLLADPAARARMGERARAAAVARCSVPVVAETWERIHRERLLPLGQK